MACRGLTRVRATRPGAQVVLLKNVSQKIVLSKNVLFNTWISLNSQVQRSLACDGHLIVSFIPLKFESSILALTWSSGRYCMLESDTLSLNK